MAEAVYILCALTSLLCAVLLLRAWRRSHLRLLLWSALCFGFLALNNFFVVLDLVVLPGLDLRLWRNLLAVAGILTLLYGFIMDQED